MRKAVGWQYYLKWGWVSRVGAAASSNLGPRAASAPAPFEWLPARISPSREKEGEEKEKVESDQTQLVPETPWNVWPFHS